MRSPIFNFRRNAFSGALFAAVLLGSCKKEFQQPESTWTINGENFSTREVEWSKNKAGVAASWIGKRSSAGYTLESPSLGTGTYKLKTKESGTDPTYMGLGFSKGDLSYEALPGKTVRVELLDYTYTLTLEPTPFRQRNDTLKTVLISATLRYKEEE